MESLVLDFGYPGLFLMGFLAATLLPLGSEAAVVFAVVSGFNPVFILVAATAGNFLGALANFGVGKWGRRFLFSKFIRLKPHQLDRAEATLGKWGAPILFFAWVPVIGDPITVAAGMLNVNLFAFSFWVFTGKALRYLFVLKGVHVAMG